MSCTGGATLSQYDFGGFFVGFSLRGIIEKAGKAVFFQFALYLHYEYIYTNNNIRVVCFKSSLIIGKFLHCSIYLEPNSSKTFFFQYPFLLDCTGLCAKM